MDLTVDILIKIRKEFTALVCNYGLQPVLTEESWKEMLVKAIEKEGLTQSQQEDLLFYNMIKEKELKDISDKYISYKGIF